MWEAAPNRWSLMQVHVSGVFVCLVSRLLTQRLAADRMTENGRDPAGHLTPEPQVYRTLARLARLDLPVSVLPCEFLYYRTARPFRAAVFLYVPTLSYFALHGCTTFWYDFLSGCAEG